MFLAHSIAAQILRRFFKVAWAMTTPDDVVLWAQLAMRPRVLTVKRRRLPQQSRNCSVFCRGVYLCLCQGLFECASMWTYRGRLDVLILEFS
jgi:hypothetical protein